MMREDQDVVSVHRGVEGRMAGVARGGFDTVAAIASHLHADDLQLDPETGAQLLAQRGPVIRIRVQAMVDVQRAQAGGPGVIGRREQMQQDARIEAAAQPDHERATGAGRGNVGEREHRAATYAAS
jgi:hypothetical protein